MSSRRFIPLLVGLALVGALVVVGRIESSDGIRSQNRGIQSLWRWVQPVWEVDDSISGYRVARTFDCLLYEKGADPYAVEFCFDSRGRVVEAIDRRKRHPVFWDLTYEPSASEVTVDPARLATLFREIGADASVGYTGNGMPIGYEDAGPTLLQPAAVTTPTARRAVP